tara:strand:+ start:153 stop:596 length:444 start_codon:yes stop_codon:yes gene_type:complete
MSKKDRIINDWRFMLHQKWEHSVLEEEPKIQGELKTKFRNLLQKEADNELNEADEMLLTAYKSTFNFNAEYSVDRWYELEDFPSTVEVDAQDCDDLEEARRLMSGEQEMETPDYDYVLRNTLDFRFGDCKEKEIFVSLKDMDLKEEF